MRSITATVTFAASHKQASEGPHTHGHTYICSATELASNERLAGDLLPDFRAVISELHLRDLDQMLNGGSSSLEGLAAWLMERLLMRHPRLVRMTAKVADQPELEVAVEREIR